MNEKKSLKDVDLRLIAELMKNSRRSDRELAKAIGVSQPTVSRTIKKIQKEGYIKEYTMIPNFTKLGFEILALTTFKLKDNVPMKELDEKRKALREEFKSEPLSHILGMSGIGMKADRMIITLHEDYASYTKYLERIRKDPLVKMSSMDTFIISLADNNHFDSLTLSPLANYILKTRKKESE
jgi:DNA-binding Lrp family transcriptional regulator